MKNYNLLKFGQILILFCLFSIIIVAQTPKTPQVPPVKPVNPVKETPPANWEKDGIAANQSDIPFEKSLAVDSKVSVSFCVAEGNVKINGWDRDEIRVFVEKGSKVGFRPASKNSQGNPMRVTILGYEPLKDTQAGLSPCLSGEVIEINLPKNSALKIDGREANIEIEAVNKVYVRNNEGDVSLNEIEQSSEVKTWEGNISVVNSRGSSNLESVNGNILAYQIEAREIDDFFKAKTNSGTITLQSIKHSVIEATSISGMIKYIGEILSDGQYNFSNTSGQILLTIPKESSCGVQVISAKGKFNSEMPLQNINENIFYPSMQKIVGKLGDGEANINLATQSGFIRIKKLD